MAVTGISGQPLFSVSEGPTFDGLIANGPVKTRSITIELDADAADTLYVRGRIMNKDVDGKYHAVSSTETTVTLGATTEVVVDSLLAASGTAPVPFTLAHPPVPGTVHVATTATGSATVLKELGTDNGSGYGEGAGGHFTIDYATGAGVATFLTAATDTNDLKAGYKYRAIDAADSLETLGGLDFVILGEDIPAARINAADIRTFAYDAGEFNASKLVGYSAGYLEVLRHGGIYVR